MKQEGGTRPKRQAAPDPLLILHAEGEPDDAWYEQMGRLHESVGALGGTHARGREGPADARKG